MRLEQEVFKRVLRWIVNPGHGGEERFQNGVSLGGAEIGEGFRELTSGLGIEAVETGAVEGLTVSWRDADEEVEKIRGIGIERAQTALQRGKQNAAQLFQGGVLSRGEELVTPPAASSAPASGIWGTSPPPRPCPPPPPRPGGWITGVAGGCGAADC